MKPLRQREHEHTITLADCWTGNNGQLTSPFDHIEQKDVRICGDVNVSGDMGVLCLQTDLDIFVKLMLRGEKPLPI